MYHFRPFRNSDPPRIAEIWRDQPPQRGVMQPVTAALLEQLVFAKPYFDPEGLILALADERPVGFVHAGFGASDEQSAVDTDSGTTYLMMLRADSRDAALADQLLNHAEDYLRRRGAKLIYAGGVRPLNAFYLGLYGGSELPGILVSDPVAHDAYRRRRIAKSTGFRCCSSIWRITGRHFRVPSVNCAAKHLSQKSRRRQPQLGGKHARHVHLIGFITRSRQSAEAIRWRQWASGTSSHYPRRGEFPRLECSI